ncbi:DNA methyltransferase [Dyadobacter frigoris]|uniref:HsdM family class I SAM-dependent methyltransferase n=1 Tax=Dyadobacter frigoris TaxID=2576211 RepID=UPI0024A0BF77|nr:N-6 DNA methylase [Dyadobacter frigoris]GLU56468.1 DNA methyltransferase [Dyadobacter frigoris]
MASLRRNVTLAKSTGRVYTPEYVVKKMLTDSGFYSLDFSTSNILDPACGDGKFLIPIVRHIIENTPVENLKESLLNVYGWDIDREAIKTCRSQLDELLLGLDLIVDWNVKVTDALQMLDSELTFKLIIGNPPYIRIQHLTPTLRSFIKFNYTFCRKGATDVFYAFFELSSRLLSKNGTAALVTPNSYFTSATGIGLRAFFQQNQNLVQITNFGSISLFQNTGTYSAITIFHGSVLSDTFLYEVCDDSMEFESCSLTYNEIAQNDYWQLCLRRLANHEFHGKRLGEISQISVGLTTLADSYYIFKPDVLPNFFTNKVGMTIELESQLLRPIVKGSKLKDANDCSRELILFPYQMDTRGSNKIISEETMIASYPLAYSYFLSIASVLKLRDNGKENPVAWYAFGRSQALNTSFGKKVIFSPINKKPNFILSEEEDCTVYSGYFLKFDGCYVKLLEQLNSQRMEHFIKVLGRDFRGGYKGYNKKILENFIVNL